MRDLSRFGVTLVLSVALTPLLGVGVGFLLVAVGRIVR